MLSDTQHLDCRNCDDLIGCLQRIRNKSERGVRAGAESCRGSREIPGSTGAVWGFTTAASL